MALLDSVAPSVVGGPVGFRDAEMALFQRLGQGVPPQWVLSSQLGVDTPVLCSAGVHIWVVPSHYALCYGLVVRHPPFTVSLEHVNGSI